MSKYFINDRYAVSIKKQKYGAKSNSEKKVCAPHQYRLSDRKTDTWRCNKCFRMLESKVIG